MNKQFDIAASKKFEKKIYRFIMLKE